MTRTGFIAAALTAAVFLSACGKPGPEEDPADAVDRGREISLFTNAVRLVQERYVDIDRVELNRIISNSLVGAVTAVDPYAEVYFTGAPEDPAVPPDVPMLEWSGPDDYGILGIRIYGFNESLKKELKKVRKRLRDSDPSGILLDARGAFGQDYEAAAGVAELFLSRGAVIGSLVQSQGEHIETYTSRFKPLWLTNMTVVLQDQTLSGPGEFLAAALRANERCVLVGQPSRGMAVIRKPIPLTPEWTVLLSTASAREPGGRDISGNPIIPDITAQPDPGSTENVDWVYARGLALLRDQHSFSRQETGEP